MTDRSASAGTMTHFRRLSWKSRLAESRAIIVFFFAAFFMGIAAGAFIPLLCHLSLGGGTNYFPLFFFGGMAGSLGVVFAVRFVDRKLFGAMKAGILAVEDRVIAGNSKTQMEDLEKLVSGYLKLKRMEAADYYSKQLLELSKSGGTEVMKLSDWMVTSECWVSSDEYQRGWNYKLVWLFETRGVLTLSPHKLDFQSKKFHFTCDPTTDIVSIEIKRHPLWLKPIPFRYISVTISENGVKHTFNLTPSFGQTDTVFDCNKLVDKWYERLQNAAASTHSNGRGGLIGVHSNSTHTGRIPDWMSDLSSSN